MDFDSGWKAAVDECYRRLTNNIGRTEAYEETIEWLKRERGE